MFFHVIYPYLILKRALGKVAAVDLLGAERVWNLLVIAAQVEIESNF